MAPVFCLPWSACDSTGDVTLAHICVACLVVNRQVHLQMGRRPLRAGQCTASLAVPVGVHACRTLLQACHRYLHQSAGDPQPVQSKQPIISNLQLDELPLAVPVGIFSEAEVASGCWS